MTEKLSNTLLHFLISRANFSGPGGSIREIQRTRDSQFRQIHHFVERGLPLSLVILGFPAKSPNREKTLGDLPDRGEVEALRYLDHLCTEISDVYSPGAKIEICSDGRVFADLVRVEDETVSRYQEAIRGIVSEFGFQNLSTFHLEEIYSGGNFDEIRSRMLSQFGEELGSLREKTLSTHEGRMLFNGIHRFVFEDLCILEKSLSRTAVRKKARDLAYQVIQRSQAFSQLVAQKFPLAVRLSIHPQLPFSEKIGLSMIPSRDRWATPWHNVLLDSPRGLHLVTRREAEDQGAKIHFLDEKYPFFSLGEEFRCLA
jgi:L-tyrosine isonitrile synthase